MQEWMIDSSYLEPGEYVVWKGRPEKGQLMDPNAFLPSHLVSSGRYSR